MLQLGMITLPSLDSLLEQYNELGQTRANKIGTIAGQIIGTMAVKLKERGLDNEAIAGIAIDSSYKIISFLLACPENEEARKKLAKEQKDEYLASLMLSRQAGEGESEH